MFRSLFDLRSSHLYGRHLVLEWAKADDSLEELRDKAASDVAVVKRARRE